MSIPYAKQKHFNRLDSNQRAQLKRIHHQSNPDNPHSIPQQGVGQPRGRAATGAATRSPAGARPSLGGAALALMIIVGGVMIIPGVSAAFVDLEEGFEDLPNFQAPDGAFYSETGSTGNYFVSENAAQARTGDKFLKATGGANGVMLFDTEYTTCDDNGAYFTTWVFITAAATTDTTIRLIDTADSQNFATFDIDGATQQITGIVRGSANAASTSAVLATAPAGSWFDLSITLTNCAGATATFGSGTLGFGTSVDQVGGWGPTEINSANIIIGTNGDYRFDDMGFGLWQAADTLPSTSATVVGLNGYSMSNDGQHIVVRLDSGTTVATYATADLSAPIATVASGCNRVDGVISASLNGEIWITYADCTVPTIVDALRIRNSALGIPVFPNDCEGEPTEDVENNANIDVPDNMQQMGTLADMDFSFEECINPAGPAIGAFASWTFSSSADGWIAAFAAMYGNIGGPGDEESWEEHAPALDTTGSPQVDDFCSWQASDGNDYIGGVSQNGAVAVYQVIRDASVSATFGADVDFTFEQKFRNSGPPYAGSFSIACAGDRVAIQTPTEVRVLQGITGSTPTLLRTIPIDDPTDSRNLAMTGTAEYLIVGRGTGIEVYSLDTGNLTGSHPLPVGSWRGIETSNAGAITAVFTSTRITVIESAEATCELDGNCESLDNVGDDGTFGPGPTSTGTTTGGPTVPLEDNPYFWVLIWMLIVLVGLALLSWGTRAGFGGLVYGTALLIVYIIGMLLEPDEISAWPVVVCVAFAIGMGIKAWVSR